MLRNKLNTRLFVTFSLAIFLNINCFSAAWDIPADQKEKKSYIKFDKQTSSQGEVLYNANCASCHGNPGKNNSLKSLNPLPPDLAGKTSQALTDGDLHYILNTGRGLMPAFKNVISAEEQWKVISYLRGFNPAYVQELSKFDPNKSKLVKLTSNFDSKTNSLVIEAIANEKSGKIPLKKAEIAVFVKRYFGNIQIEKTVLTDDLGKAAIVFPKDLPGNKTGELEVLVKFFDQNYGEVQAIEKLAIGIPTDKPALNEKRAIWNVLAKAPFWTIFLYLSGLVTFLFLLLYLLNNLRKIFNSKTI
ncbi:MAG TPA: cytochrome c [Paludibacter sp.]|nr:cytochrome c [Paludibacter sp.]